MADTDLIKMRLTFPRGKQQPGEIVDVRADEVHRWKGFAVAVDEPKPAAKAPTPPAETPKASK
ncbi:hypothetical protein [Streptomyces sp. NBC_00338]|uniref:hypothetical protein n=1 Tax=Streptomyces sp. NBC_00338 TaxID=2975715 RepID=UPI002254B27A|nr:hypothetical protein [Streptomyces sp. NBC_00338]MCX5145085.1 hypothetical protein [Streptomyces sp. NBC_00338]